jgi:hypothetical protein
MLPSLFLPMLALALGSLAILLLVRVRVLLLLLLRRLLPPLPRLSLFRINPCIPVFLDRK